jgi:antitoxin ParD1/3/4
VEEQEKLHAVKVVELHDVIQAGITSGPGFPAEEVFDRLQKEYAAHEDLA